MFQKEMARANVKQRNITITCVNLHLPATVVNLWKDKKKTEMKLCKTLHIFKVMFRNNIIKKYKKMYEHKCYY